MTSRLSKLLLLVVVISLSGTAWVTYWLHGKAWQDNSLARADQSAVPIPTFAITPKLWPLSVGHSIAIANIEASSLILIDVGQNQIIAERQAHTRRPMASLTKIMTAAIVLEFAQPDSLVTIPKPATQHLPADSAIMGISPGEQYTVRELLYGLLLPSGNDAAQALALAVAGSQPRFVAMMNAKARQLGLKDTHFTNPSGLDGANHYSTAYDLAIITHYAQSLPLFNTIVATKQKQLAYSPKHKYLDLVNANAFISMYEGATGVKPGNTGLAGNCLVASANRSGHQLLGVLLDTPGRNTNMIKLFDLALANL